MSGTWAAALSLAFLVGWLLPQPWRIRPAGRRLSKKRAAILEAALDEHDEHVRSHAAEDRHIDRRHDLMGAIQRVRETFRQKKRRPPTDDQVREALRCRRPPI